MEHAGSLADQIQHLLSQRPGLKAQQIAEELKREDQVRSRRLRDFGWDIMRFWVYDLAGSVARVKEWIEKQG